MTQSVNTANNIMDILAIPAYCIQDFLQPELQSYLKGNQQHKLVSWLDFYFYDEFVDAVRKLDSDDADYTIKLKAILRGQSRKNSNLISKKFSKNFLQYLEKVKEQGCLPELEQELIQNAASGDMEAMENLAYCYQYGKFGSIDIIKALQWYLAAASMNDGAAMGEIGDILKKKGDLPQAKEWYQRGADHDDEYCKDQVAKYEGKAGI